MKQALLKQGRCKTRSWDSHFERQNSSRASLSAVRIQWKYFAH